MSLTNLFVPTECHDVLRARETFAPTLPDAFHGFTR